MTDDEWQNCTSPGEMLDAMRDANRANKRKLCLFGSACCRSLGSLLVDEELRAITLIEGYLDGQCEREVLGKFEWNEDIEETLRRDVDTGTPEGHSREAVGHLLWNAHREHFTSSEIMQASLVQDALGVLDQIHEAVRLRAEAESPVEANSGPQAAVEALVPTECRYLRDLFGNPSRPTTLDPAVLAWNDGTVVKIARAIYDERNFADLPILADALLDAGCTDEAIQAHFRDGGEHIRGCWVLDLVLNQDKEWSTPPEVTQLVLDYGRATIEASNSIMGLLRESLERRQAEERARGPSLIAILLFVVLGGAVLGFLSRGSSPRAHSLNPALRGDFLDQIKVIPFNAKPITFPTFREPPELLPPPGQEEE